MFNRRLSSALLIAATFAFFLSLQATGCSSSSGGTTSDGGGDVQTTDSTSTQDGPVDSGNKESGSEASSCGTGLTSCSGKCVNTSTDSMNCGVCGATCGSGLVCSAGTCAISCGDASGLTQCGSGCYDTTTDSDNCGSCGNKCPTGEVCNNSTCGFSCGAGSTLCNGACVDTNTDNANCGKCGTACVSGTVCGGGTCSLTCMNGYSTCGADAGAGYCANTQTDNNNCGSCGHQCSGGQVCSLGSCSTTCGSGLVDCSGKCVNPQSDNNYCGATAGCGVGDAGGSAGTVCPSGTACNGGSCTISCPPGEVNCSGVCVDPLNDNNHCGVQPGCTGGAACTGSTPVCSNGSCLSVCAAPLVLCGGSCVNPNTSTQYCGASANCAGMNAGTQCQPGQVCSGGTCALTCPPGLVACGGSCIDPSTNNVFCGAQADCQGFNAGHTCLAGYVCSSGSCQLSCQSGLIDCNNTCIDPLSDPTYCGASGDCSGAAAGTNCTTMGGGYVCTGGNPDGGLPLSTCQLSCQPGLVDCAGVCIDPKTSKAYCGATPGCGTNGGSAGTPCTVVGSSCTPTGSTPVGACTCPVGSDGVQQIACTPSGSTTTECIDPSTNAEFCGVGAGCTGGTDCLSGPNSITGSSCSGNQCVCPVGSDGVQEVSCTPSGSTQAECVDPSTNNEFCGAGPGCAGGINCVTGPNSITGSSCSGNQCVCPVGSDGVQQVSCTPVGSTQAECIDPNTNNSFCGALASNSCAMATTLNGSNGYTDCSQIVGSTCGGAGVPGQCGCPGNEVDCLGTCIDPTTNNNYCGATTGCAPATTLTPTPNGYVNCGSGYGSIVGSNCTTNVSPGGSCTCPTGADNVPQVVCTAPTLQMECVDPSTSNDFCGANASCTQASTPDATPGYTNCATGITGSSCTAVTTGSPNFTPIPPYGTCSCPLSPTGVQEVICNNECVDPSSNSNYCGAVAGCPSTGPNAYSVCSSQIVGSSCTKTASAPYGACTCGVNGSGVQEVDCGGKCIDPTTSPINCGANGTCSVLPPPSGTGTYGTTNFEGYDCATDPAYGHGYVCTPVSGVGNCSLTCGPPTTKCGTVCTDTSKDPLNCGACAGTGPDNVCSSGICVSSVCQDETFVVGLSGVTSDYFDQSCYGAYSYYNDPYGFTWSDSAPTPLPTGASVSSLTINFAQSMMYSNCTSGGVPTDVYLTLNGQPISAFLQNGSAAPQSCGPSSTSGCYQTTTYTCTCGLSVPETIVITDSADLANYNVGGSNSLLVDFAANTDTYEGVGAISGRTYATLTVTFTPE